MSMKDADFASQPGKHEEYTRAEVATLINPLIPHIEAEDISDYIIIARAPDGRYGVSRSTETYGSTISMLAQTIELIAEN